MSIKFDYLTGQLVSTAGSSGGGGGSFDMNNNQFLTGKKVDTTSVNLIGVTPADVVQVGITTEPLNLNGISVNLSGNSGSVNIYSATNVAIASNVSRIILQGASPDSPGLEFQDISYTKHVRFTIPSSLTNTYTLMLPDDQGASGETLVNDGLGNLTWALPGSGANQALSNLTNPTAINQEMIFGTGIDGYISSKFELAGNSGEMNLRTGDALTTGGVNVKSGDGDTTGGVFITTGGAAVGSSGNILMSTGSGVGGSGSITLETAASSPRGEIYLNGDAVNILNEKELRWYDSGSNFYTGLKSKTTLAGSTTYTLPEPVGTVGTVMSNDGFGNMSWSGINTLGAVKVQSGAGSISVDDFQILLDLTQSGTFALELPAPQDGLRFKFGTSGSGVLAIYNLDAVTNGGTLDAGAISPVNLGTVTYMEIVSFGGVWYRI